MKHLHPDIPQWADRFLQWYCAPDLLEEVQGDIYEMFKRNSEEVGIEKARKRFIWDVIRFFTYSTIKGNRTIHWYSSNVPMYKNYIISAFRYFKRQKVFTLLNILGLTIGICSSICIGLWVYDEWTYDRFLPDSENIYLIRTNFFTGDKLETWYTSPRPLGAIIDSVIPEVVETENMWGYPEDHYVGLGERHFQMKGKEAGKNIFKVFPFPFLQGNPHTALSEPNSIVISATSATKLFGPDWNEKVLIDTLLSLNQQSSFKLTGIFEDIPTNSSFSWDYLLSYGDYSNLRDWDDINYQTYVKIDHEVEVEKVEEKIAQIYREQMEAAFPNEINWDMGNGAFLQAFHRVHLYSNFEHGQESGGRILYVRLLAIIAGMILLIACINYMNLSTAQSIKRAKEIGIRKVIGAKKTQLVVQFMIEALMITFLALLFAVGLVHLLLPSLNAFFSKSITIAYTDTQLWVTLILLWVGISLIAGSYPAFFLSTFRPVRIMKGIQSFSITNLLLRKGLVVFQFTVSMLIIIFTLGIYFQLTYIKQKNLGFDRSYMIYRDFSEEEREKMDAYMTELRQKIGSDKVALCSTDMLSPNLRSANPSWEGKDPNKLQLFTINFVDQPFLEMIDIQLIDGRFFSATFAGDSNNFIINETAANIMNMQDPVGQSMTMWGDQTGTIIGLVKDYHQNSLHVPIDPMIICLKPAYANHIFIKATAGNMQKTIQQFEAVYRDFGFSAPFEYQFLDEQFEALYESEQKYGTLTILSAALSILISCLGLFGLAMFAAETRTKEISIRKVLGATVPNIIVLFSKDYVKLVFIAVGISVPLGIFGLDQWLNQYAYKMNMSPWIFITAGGVLVLLALGAVIYQAIRSALALPSDYLRADG